MDQDNLVFQYYDECGLVDVYAVINDAKNNVTIYTVDQFDNGDEHIFEFDVGIDLNDACKNIVNLLKMELQVSIH